MRRFVLFFILAALATAAIFESGVASSLLAFLLVGVVPGTDIVMAPNTMLMIIGAILWLLLVQTTVFGLINLRTIRKLVARHTERSKRLPKRRFSQI